MENALLLGLSRQVALGRELESVANNLANINTTGYKADRTIFEQYLMPLASADDMPAGNRQLSFVRDRATWHNMTTGPILHTGSPTDVAIDGDGFLVVQTPQGQRYTRNGALQINATGTLVTSAGDPVLGIGGPITFQNTDSNVSIGADGTITVREGASATSDAARQAADRHLCQQRPAAEGRIEPVLGSDRGRARPRTDGYAGRPGSDRAVERERGRRDGAYDRHHPHLYADLQHPAAGSERAHQRARQALRRADLELSSGVHDHASA